jgi:hypothetical protein
MIALELVPGDSGDEVPAAQPRSACTAIKGISGKSVCSEACASHFSSEVEKKIPEHSKLRNANNIFPLPPKYSPQDMGEETAEQWNPVSEQLQLYGLAHAVTEQPEVSGASSAAASSTRTVIRASTFVSAGRVLCAVTGSIEDVEKKGEEKQSAEGEEKKGSDESKSEDSEALPSHRKLLLKNLGDFVAGKQLVVSPGCAYSHMRVAQGGEHANAVLVAQFSLTVPKYSPLRSKKFFAPGSIVVIARSAIGPQEEIVLQPPRTDENGHSIVPKPTNEMEDEPVEIQGDVEMTAENGYWRLPDDLPLGSTGKAKLPENDPPREVHLAAIHNLLIPNEMGAKVVKSFKALSKSGHPMMDDGIFHLSSFRGTTLLPVGAEKCNDSSTDFKALQTWATRKRVHKQTPQRAAVVHEGEIEESEFKGRYAFDKDTGRAFNPAAPEWNQQNLFDAEWLKSENPKIVLRSYLELWQCVLTTAESRKDLSKEAQHIASYPCHAFFRTERLDSSNYPASAANKQAWVEALQCILGGQFLMKQLERMEQKRKEENYEDFYPSVFLESLAALYLEVISMEEIALHEEESGELSTQERERVRAARVEWPSDFLGLSVLSLCSLTGKCSKQCNRAADRRRQVNISAREGTSILHRGSSYAFVFVFLLRNSSHGNLN